MRADLSRFRTRSSTVIWTCWNGSRNKGRHIESELKVNAYHYRLHLSPPASSRDQLIIQFPNRLIMNGPSWTGSSAYVHPSLLISHLEAYANERHASIGSSSTNSRPRSAPNTNSSSLSTPSQNTNNGGPGAGASTSSLSSAPAPPDYVATPFTTVNDRTYFRDPENPYPLPCDLPEIHRQSLRTMTLIRVFGSPYCAPQLKEKRPKKVLELACGSGLWSHACHDYFLEHDVGGPKSPKEDDKNATSFTGLDIVSIAPDLRRKGVNWQFVRHDIRKPTLPFPSEHFDFVFIKDAGLCQSATAQQLDLLGEPLRTQTWWYPGSLGLRPCVPCSST